VKLNVFGSPKQVHNNMQLGMKKNDISHALLWMVFGSETKTQSSKKMIWHNRVFHSLFVKFRTVFFLKKDRHFFNHHLPPFGQSER